jgi:acetate kinase
MDVLIINCGSSSQAFRVYRIAPRQEPTVLIAGKARHVATPTQETPFVEWTSAGQTKVRDCDLPTHAHAAGVILDIVQEESVAIDAVGHRFVHGGSEFTDTTLIDDSALSRLQRTVPLAPIHNPNTLSVIDVCLQRLPGVPQ